MAFHENLRAIRLAKGLTQPSLAEAAQIEQSYLSKLENGRSSPSDEVLLRLAGALGTSAEELMRDGADAQPAPGWRRPLFAVAAFALLGVGAIGGWFANDARRAQQVASGTPDRSYGSLTERLHGVAPAGVKLETVEIGDNGTIALTGRTVAREAVTDYLAELRRAGIGEARLMRFTDSDTRFHLLVAPFPRAPTPSAEQVAAGVAEHDAVMAQFGPLAAGGVHLERLQRSSDGAFFAAGRADSVSAAEAALAKLERAGYSFTSRQVSGDASAARFEFVFRGSGTKAPQP